MPTAASSWIKPRSRSERSNRRHFLQMDIGGLPHRDVLAAIDLLGTEAPRVRTELNDWD